VRELILSAIAMCLAPLLIVLPVHLWGLLRERAGKLAGWDGPGWRLRHLWLALAWVVVAQLVALHFLAPGFIERELWGQPVSGIEIATSRHLSSLQILGSVAAGGSFLLLILPAAPLCLLWTSTWSAPRALLAGWIAFLGIMVLLAALSPILPEIGSSDHPQRELTEVLATLGKEHSLWALLLVAAVLVPIMEEVLFRGVMLTAVARRVPFWFANMLQAALFASLHLSDLSWRAAAVWLVFLAMGLVAGWMTRASGGLLAAITLHALNNASAVVALSQM
jgi:uncharacterized protein